MRMSDWSSDVCSSDLMTTLDIQDGNQASLNVDIVDVADKLLKAMEKVAALFGKKGVKAVQKFHKAMMTAFRIADYAGLSLKPAPLGDFSDPDVQIWNNVIFADNYYQSVAPRSEEHTSELQSLMRISYAVFCLKKKH